jgi:hypothetical protein
MATGDKEAIEEERRVRQEAQLLRPRRPHCARRSSRSSTIFELVGCQHADRVDGERDVTAALACSTAAANVCAGR